LKPRHWNKVPQRQFRVWRIGGQKMNLRIVFFVVGILLGAALLFAGAFAEVELLTDRQCGASYLCDPPTADAGHAPVDRRVVAR
jgi:hypothetical protein